MKITFYMANHFLCIFYQDWFKKQKLTISEICLYVEVVVCEDCVTIIAMGKTRRL
jgi:hypothetical protein